jgi:hypothetical protein
MEAHDLTPKMMAKLPKITRNCESSASLLPLFRFLLSVQLGFYLAMRNGDYLPRQILKSLVFRILFAFHDQEIARNRMKSRTRSRYHFSPGSIVVDLRALRGEEPLS